MNIIFGAVLLISLMTLIFLGPEYYESLRKRHPHYKKIGNPRRRTLSRGLG